MFAELEFHISRTCRRSVFMVVIVVSGSELSVFLNAHSLTPNAHNHNVTFEYNGGQVSSTKEMAQYTGKCIWASKQLLHLPSQLVIVNQPVLCTGLPVLTQIASLISGPTSK